jgi:hypothetical protein
VGLKSWLGLKKPYDAWHRVKRWPADLAEDHEGPIVSFGIPLKSAKTSGDWSRTQALLGATLRSVFRQSDPRWRVLVCGHEMPETAEIGDPRVEFVAAEWSPPSPGDGSGGLDDQFRKRAAIGARVYELGAGYYMDLDGDDLIHRDLAATALATEHGCIITTGYICDAMAHVIAPLPGALSVDFDRVCGSMAVIRYEQADFPPLSVRQGFVDASRTLFGGTRNHPYVRGRCEEIGRPLAPVPFPAAIYVINTQENYSLIHLRESQRRSHLISLVHAHAIRDKEKLQHIAEAFGWIASPVDSLRAGAA